MESAIAKYDHVVQCLRELKQIYRNAEMFETVLSPHTVNFTHSGLYFKILRYLQKLPEATILLQVGMVWKTVEAWFLKGLCPNNCLWSTRMFKSCFHTGVVESKAGFNGPLYPAGLRSHIYSVNAWVSNTGLKTDFFSYI